MEQHSGTLGIDLGSVNVKAAWLPAVEGTDPSAFWAPGRGNPLAALSALLDGSLTQVVGDEPMRVSLTGIAQTLLGPLVPATRLNEVVATALAVARSRPGTRTVIDVGGQFTKWILLDGDRVADFALNGLCAAGSGAFLEQQATRLKLSVDELGRLACEAERGAAVAGRCSVFAKSDMIHLQQKGTPAEEIAYGVCLALARTFAATVLGGRRVEPPVVVVGGGAANPGLVRALREVLELAPDDVVVPSDHITLGARGAALSSAEADRAGEELTLEALVAALRTERRAGPVTPAMPLAPLAPHARPDSSKPDEDPPRAGSGPVRVYVGVDVGSVSTNVVLLSPEHELLQGIYLPTRGQPMAVLDEALRQVEEKYGDDLVVLGVGATGSGRHLAAKALGADTVTNEISAQMFSAAHYFPEVDTVFEIGGQDSKYIGARQGRLASFEMNKICAAGTGSFLEEQAERLGVKIRGEFADLALQAAHPRDLGSRCTVFMDTELVRSLEQGASAQEVCAGLAYSIARNYLDKVVAGHAVGDTVVFQGGTASNEAVAAAMRALTGKRVVVHPYNRVSGAIGAALLAMRDHRRAGGPSTFRGVEACRDARTKSFECRRCPNRCQVIKVTVGGLSAHFGDTCERYSERDDERRDDRPDRGKPTDLFAARQALLERHLPPRRADRRRAVIPRATASLEMAPFWGAVAGALGYGVSMSEPSTLELVELGAAGLPAEVCLPIKIAAGHVRRALEDPTTVVLAPAAVDVPGRDDGGRCHTCLYTQELPSMLGRVPGDRLLTPQCSIAAARGGHAEAEATIAQTFGVSRRVARGALRRGVEAQRRFDQERVALGRRVLEGGADRIAIVLGRPYNVHDPFMNLDLARRLRKLGLEAVPMDMLPLDEVELPAELDRLLWRFSRDQLKALSLALSSDRLFPVWVSSFGCGLDGFAFKHVEAALGDRPALILEFDEHRGEAGLVTRLEAFSDEIDEFLRDTNRARPRPPFVPRKPRGHSGRFVIPHIADHAHAVAAALRSVGWDAEALPVPDQATVALGEEHTSGRECHPFVVVAGELLRWATSTDARPGDVFYYPQAANPCLISQYGDGHQKILERLGLDHVHAWGIGVRELIPFIGGQGGLRIYEGYAAVDILLSTACARRPYELVPGSVDQVYRQALGQVCEAVARRERAAASTAEGVCRLMAVPLDGTEGTRPLVGVCGDLATRINETANAGLFTRLESMGCQVWPHPYMAGIIDCGSWRYAERNARRGNLGSAAFEMLLNVGGDRVARPMREAVPEEIRHLVVEPDPREYAPLADPYVGQVTNNLVVENVAKAVDFARRGADGVINAIGLGCMVGIASEGMLRHVRSDYPDVPMVTLAYSCAEGPTQRVRLETFVHQVHERHRRRRSMS